MSDPQETAADTGRQYYGRFTCRGGLFTAFYENGQTEIWQDDGEESPVLVLAMPTPLGKHAARHVLESYKLGLERGHSAGRREVQSAVRYALGLP